MVESIDLEVDQNTQLHWLSEFRMQVVDGKQLLWILLSANLSKSCRKFPDSLYTPFGLADNRQESHDEQNVKMGMVWYGMVWYGLAEEQDILCFLLWNESWKMCSSTTLADGFLHKWRTWKCQLLCQCIFRLICQKPFQNKLGNEKKSSSRKKAIRVDVSGWELGKHLFSLLLPSHASFSALIHIGSFELQILHFWIGRENLTKFDLLLELDCEWGGGQVSHRS